MPYYRYSARANQGTRACGTRKKGRQVATKGPRGEGLWGLRGPICAHLLVGFQRLRHRQAHHARQVENLTRPTAATPTRKMSNLRARGGGEGVACVCGWRGGIKELPAAQPTPKFAELAHHSSGTNVRCGTLTG